MLYVVFDTNVIVSAMLSHNPQSPTVKVVESIIKLGVQVDRIDSGERFPDPADAVFYEAALSKEGSFLVTGNTRHFPQSPIVVTPSELLAIID